MGSLNPIVVDRTQNTSLKHDTGVPPWCWTDLETVKTTIETQKCGHKRESEKICS